MGVGHKKSLDIQLFADLTDKVARSEQGIGISVPLPYQKEKVSIPRYQFIRPIVTFDSQVIYYALAECKRYHLQVLR